jgi:type I restriction enzyme, R subunit
MKPDERGFEDAITASLVEAGGYRVCKWGTKPEWVADFDRVRGLDVAELFAFLAETQPKAWERLVAVHGGADGARTHFAERLARQLDERGTVDVLRHGINDHGIEVRLAFFKPAHGLTPELTERYLANRLTVTRQLPYDAAPAKTIDLCLFVNGIPVATAELKNPLTHQAVEHAMRISRVLATLFRANWTPRFAGNGHPVSRVMATPS